MKSKNYWIKEKCAEEALKYSFRSEFEKYSGGAYYSALRHNWLDDICLHMITHIKPNGYWTYEKCKEEALKCSNKIEFKKNFSRAYFNSRKNNWLDDICLHMTVLRNSNGCWTYEKCKEEALKYKTRSEFNKYCSGGYNSAWKNNWLDDICSHMKIIGNLMKRCVYVYEFPNNYAYVGLTHDFDERNDKHLNINTIKISGQVAKHIIKTNLYPISKLLTDYINIEEAKKFEKYYYDKYKNNDWVMLNKNKTGGIGGNYIVWTKEKCLNELYKYGDIIKLKINHKYVYNKIIKNNWL
jgi:hypothetical protein